MFRRRRRSGALHRHAPRLRRLSCRRLKGPTDLFLGRTSCTTWKPLTSDSSRSAGRAISAGVCVGLLRCRPFRCVYWRGHESAGDAMSKRYMRNLRSIARMESGFGTKAPSVFTWNRPSRCAVSAIRDRPPHARGAHPASWPHDRCPLPSRSSRRCSTHPWPHRARSAGARCARGSSLLQQIWNSMDVRSRRLEQVEARTG